MSNNYVKYTRNRKVTTYRWHALKGTNTEICLAILVKGVQSTGEGEGSGSS